MYWIPENEQGVLYLFSRFHEKLGFEIEAKKGNSPPTQDENGKLWDDIYFTISKKDWDIKQKIARSNLR